MRLFQEAKTLASGQSYWKAQLTTGRVLCELNTVSDIRQACTRRMEWLEDLIGSGDLRRVVEISLCTPHGEVHLVITRPCTAFQLNCGMLSIYGREKTAQIIGRIDDLEGNCTAAIWDAVEQRLYPQFLSNVHRFAAWREGLVPLGMLNLEALGVRL